MFLLASFILLILAVFYFDLHLFFTADKIEAWVEGFGIFGPVAYMVLYYVGTLLLIPATVFTVLSGLLFGKVFGSIYVVLAATLAAQTGFYIARYLGHESAEKFGGGKGAISSLINKINAQVEKNGLQAFVMIRCFFLPYMPVSYASGLVKNAKARDFFFGTLITNAVFSPAFVFLGDAITKGWKAFILPVTLIVLVLCVPRIAKKMHRKKA